MDRDVVSSAGFNRVASAHTSGPTCSTAPRGRATVLRWLQSLLVLCLLLGVVMPAWADCSSPETATVPSGGAAVFSCAEFGFWLPADDPPDHGSLGSDPYALVYTNNGDGALSDTFVVRDDYNVPITFNITVLPASSLTVSPATLPTPNIGVAYSQTLSTSGGTAPYTYSIAGGDFPPGLSLSPTGTISGTPTQSGGHSFTVGVSDSAGTPLTASKSYLVNIPAPTLDISPDSPPAGVETAAYSVTLNGSGGTAPYSFQIESGSLPLGLNLASSGAITGTPAAGSAGSYTVRLRMDDNTTKSNNADKHWMVQDITFVIQPPPTITVTPATLPNATAGATYTQALGASGGAAPYTFAVTGGSLPAGLSLAANGALAGTPTAGGNFAVTVTATDSNGFEGEQSYTLVVAAADIDLSSGLASTNVGVAYAGSITASGGTAPYSYAVTAGTLPAGLTLNSATGAIAGTATAGGTFNFTVTATDSSTGAGPYTGSLAYELLVYSPTMTLTPSALPDGLVGEAYSQAFGTSGGTAPYSYAVTGGALPTGLSLTAGGVLSGTPTAAGTFNFTVNATDSSTGTGPYSKTGTYEVTIDSAAPIANPVSATVAYGSGANPITLDVTGGAADSVAVATAPGHGTAIASGTAITYQPAAGYAGADSFTYTASNADGTSVPATVSVTVSAPTLAMTPAAGTLAPGYGVAYSQVFSASGGAAPYSYALTGTLPAGLAFDTASGTLSGAATELGSFAITVTATDSSTGAGAPFSVATNYSVQVGPASIVVAPATLADGSAGSAYSQSFLASGGVAPYAYALAAGALPPGLQLQADGTLSGTPTASGTFAITVQATDAHAQTGTRAYVLRIDPATLSLSPASVANGVLGSGYGQVFTASGGIAPYAYQIASGALPPGLALDAASGELAGTPTAIGSYTFDVRATDSSSGTAATVVTGYTLVIAEAPPVAVDDAASTLAGQAVTIAVTDNDSGVIDAIAVDTAPGHGSVRVDGRAAVYTPAAGFSGSDSFRYVASGPGGSSAAATVTVEVAPLPVPVAKPQSLTTLAGEMVRFDAATDATGGPFTGVAIVEAPAEGEVVIDGTRIGYTPLATADGTVEIRYTLANAYGASEPVTATITVNPRPIAATHQANTLSGGKVSVELTDNARGGPFTGAELLSVSPAEAGDASITATGEGDSAGYRLDFSAAANYAGTATVRYTLSNAYATSAAATVSIEVEARPDPTRDAEVTGLLRAQVASVRRLARGQLGNFQQRMEQLHGGREASAGFDNGLSVAINRQCGEREWQIVGSTCPRPLHDERAPVIEPVAATGTRSPAPEFGIWTAGAMSFGDYDARRGASGFEFETQGISFGVDRHFSPTLALGAGLGYGRDVSDVGDNGSRSEADAWSAAVYASYHPGEHMYLDALLGRQWLSLQLRRHVTANGAQVHGERDGRQWLASVTGGYQWQHDQLGMTTYARVDAAHARLDGYVEQGDPVQALAFDAQDVDSTTTSLGWRMDYRREFDWGSFTPQFRVEYQHDLDADSVATMRYADLLDGPFYRTDVDGFDRNRFVLGLGAGWLTDRQLGLRLEYRSVLGDSGVDDQSLLLQVEKQY